VEIRPRISVDPNICHGRPTVSGTRMRVIDILEMLSDGATEAEIIADFDFLTTEDIRACLAYAAESIDHRVIKAAA
jgi:uncharacterized protein (DUF433 family)